MEKQLLTTDDRVKGVTIEFNLEGLLRADSAGLPPVEGGDVPRMQMQNVPIDAGQDDAIRETIRQLLAEDGNNPP